MGRASSNPKSASSCPVPNKTNGEAGGGGGGLEEEEEDDPEPASPPRRTTRLRTKAAAATSTTTATVTTANNDVVSGVVVGTPIEDKVDDLEEVELVKKKRTRQKELKSKKVSKKRERKNSSKESDVIVTTPVARRSQRVVHKLSEVKNVLRTHDDDFEVDDVALCNNVEEEHHLFDCCFIRVSGDVYRRWKEVKKRLKFTRDEQLVIYLLDQQTENASNAKIDARKRRSRNKSVKYEEEDEEEEKIVKYVNKTNGQSNRVVGEIKTEIDSAQSTASPETSKTVPISSLEEEDEPETGKRNRISRNVEPEVAKRKLTTKNARKRKEETLQKHLPDEDSDDDDDEDFEEDPSEKILKRKKISRYDCRKTPSDGIPGKPRSGLSDRDRLPNTDPYNDDKETGSDSSCPLQPTSEIDDNWCRHCDKRHLEGRIVGCPLSKPVLVVTDAVIDFSAAKETGRSEDDAGTSPVATPPPSRKDLSKSFAQLSLPTQLLELSTRTIEKTEDTISSSSILVVVARTQIKACTQFGPLQGEPILEQDIPDDFDMKDLWQVFTDSDSGRIYFSTVNPEKSNWFRYVRPAPTRRQRNVATLVKEDELYLVTLRDLEPGEEVLYWMDDPHLMWTKTRADKKNCGGCNLKFTHPLYYRTHCSVFHDPAFSLTIRKYHCKICGIAVLGKENIVKHAASQHGGRGAYQCQFCKKFFLRLNYLEMHRTYGCSSNPSRSRPVCDLCGKKFCQPQKLKVHMKRMHSGGKAESLIDFQCPICGKMLATRHAALRHRKEVHSEIGDPNPDPDISRSSLGDIGSSVADSDAGEQSTTEGSSDIVTKRLLAGSGIFPKVNCPKCPKTFKNKSNLKIHMLTHSGVKPFGCKIEGCKSGFTTKQCLQFHYRKSHGLTDEEMPKIQREIPYTLSAYSGELTDSKKVIKVRNEKEKNNSISLKRALAVSSDSLRSIRKSDVVRDVGNNDVEDVYTFHDNDDQQNQVPLDEGPSVVAQKPVKKASVVDDVITVTDRTSLLVVAALCAAEQDLKVSGSLHEDRDLELSPTDGQVKSGQGFDSPQPQSKESESPPEEVIRDDQRDLMSEGGFPEATYNLGEATSRGNVPVIPEEPPPSVSTPQQNEVMLQSEPLQSHSGYDSYLSGGPPPTSPFSRRSPVFPGSGLFQGNVPSSMMQQRDTGNYPQHPASAFPFGPPGAHGPPSGHLYHPGLDIASRYSTHFRNSSDYATPYSRTGFSHSHSDFSLPGSDAFYGGGDTSTGSIDLSSHGVTSSGSPISSPIVTTSSSSLFSHHAAASMMMMNEHLLNVNNGGRGGDSPSPATNPDILAPFSRGVAKNSDRYHPHPHAQSYYPPHPSSNPSGRFPPSPGPYHPSGSRLPHLGQSAPSPYHYGYF